MIEVTRLNGSPLVLNSDLIKTAEASPDTMLTLTTGDKLIVREECDEILRRVMEYRAQLLARVTQILGSGATLPKEFGSIVSMTGLSQHSKT